MIIGYWIGFTFTFLFQVILFKRDYPRPPATMYISMSAVWFVVWPYIFIWALHDKYCEWLDAK